MPALTVLTVLIKGYLDVPLLDQVFSPVEDELKRDKKNRYGLLVDVREMHGYDHGARSRYIKWHQLHKSRLAGVAVVTHNTVLRMAVAGVALATSAKVKPFDSDQAAKQWLGTLA